MQKKMVKYEEQKYAVHLVTTIRTLHQNIKNYRKSKNYFPRNRGSLYYSASRLYTMSTLYINIRRSSQLCTVSCRILHAILPIANV